MVILFRHQTLLGQCLVRWIGSNYRDEEIRAYHQDQDNTAETIPSRLREGVGMDHLEAEEDIRPQEATMAQEGATQGLKDNRILVEEVDMVRAVVTLAEDEEGLQWTALPQLVQAWQLER